MRPIVLVLPGHLGERTGGYLYDRRIVEGLRRLGWAVNVLELDASFPYPTPAALEHAANALAAVAAKTVAIVDSLALGAMPDLVTREASRLRIVALVHLPLAAACDLDRDTAARFEDGERRALRAAALVIVTGSATLPLIATHQLARDRVVVVEPGTDRAPLARGSRGHRLELLSVATLNPGKGHEGLLVALSEVPHREWRLTCAGSLTRHPETTERVRTTIARLGLEERVSLAGRQETYGMAVAEALAHGLPVVATTTGAIPELVGSDAGVLVPVGDTPALVEALSRVLGDASLRARLAQGARRVRDQLPTWEEASGRFAATLNSLASDG